MKKGRILVSAVLAGMCIGFGGTVFLSLEDRVLGALFFTVGLFTICTLGLHLFTGKVCYVFARDLSYALELPLIWVGNLGGTALTALLLSLTRLGPALSLKAQALVQTKVSDGFLSLFLLGVACNIFIYLAVDGFLSNPHQLGKYLSLFFGVMVFLLSGFEHCVADMFYFFLAGNWTPRHLTALLVITLGNAVGGAGFALVRSWLSKKEP